jgi:hypothetical protein
MLLLAGAKLLVFSRRIGADDKKVLARREPPVPGPRRQNDHIARPHIKLPP